MIQRMLWVFSQIFLVVTVVTTSSVGSDVILRPHPAL